MLLNTERGLPVSAALTEHYIGRTGSGFADYFAQNVKEGWDYTSINLAKRFGRSVAARAEMGPEEATRKLSREEYEAGPFARKELPFKDGLTPLEARVNAEGHDERQLRQLFLGQYTGDHELAGALGGQLAGGILAPENFVSLPGAMYLTTGMRAGKAIAQAGKVAAIENVLVTAGMAPIISQALEAEGKPYGFEEAVTDIGNAAGAGFILGAGVKAVGLAGGALARNARLRVAQKLADAEGQLKGGINGLADRLDEQSVKDFRPDAPQESKQTKGWRAWVKDGVDKVMGRSDKADMSGQKADLSRPTSEILAPKWREDIKAGQSAPTRPAASQGATDVTRAMRDLETRLTQAGERADISGVGEAIHGLNKTMKALALRVERMDASQMESVKELRIMQSRLQYILDNPDAPARPVEGKLSKREEPLRAVMQMEPEARAALAGELQTKIEAHTQAVEAHHADIQETKAVLADAAPKVDEIMSAAKEVGKTVETRVEHKIPTSSGEHVSVYLDPKRVDAAKAAKAEAATFQRWIGGDDRFLAKDKKGRVLIATRDSVGEVAFMSDPGNTGGWTFYEGDALASAVQAGTVTPDDVRAALKAANWTQPEVRMLAEEMHKVLRGANGRSSLGIMWRGDEWFIVNGRVLTDHPVHGRLAEPEVRRSEGYHLANDLKGVQEFLKAQPGLPNLKMFREKLTAYRLEFEEAKQNWFARHVQGMIDTFASGDRGGFASMRDNLARYFAHNVSAKGDAAAEAGAKVAVNRLKERIDERIKAMPESTKKMLEASWTRDASDVPTVKAMKDAVRTSYKRDIKGIVSRYFTTAEREETDIIRHIVEHLHGNDHMFVADALENLPEIGVGFHPDGSVMAERIDINPAMVRELERAQLDLDERMASAERMGRLKKANSERRTGVNNLLYALARDEARRTIIGAIKEISDIARAEALADLFGSKPAAEPKALPKRSDVREWVVELRKLRSENALGLSDTPVYHEDILARMAIQDGMTVMGKAHDGLGKKAGPLDDVELAESAMRAYADLRRSDVQQAAQAERVAGEGRDLDPAMPDTIAKPQYVEGKSGALAAHEVGDHLARTQDALEDMKDQLEKFHQSGEPEHQVVFQKVYLMDGTPLEPGAEIHPEEHAALVARADKNGKPRPLVGSNVAFMEKEIDRLTAYEDRLFASLPNYAQAGGSASARVSGDNPARPVNSSALDIRDPKAVQEARKRAEDRLAETQKDMTAEGVLDDGGRSIKLAEPRKTPDKWLSPATKAQLEADAKLNNAALAPQVNLSVETVTAKAIEKITKEGC